MSDDEHDPSNVVDILLFYLRFRYLSATECLLYLVLCGISDRASGGYVTLGRLSRLMGRSISRCRSYINRLKRYGLIGHVVSDGHGGICFKIEIPESCAKLDPYTRAGARESTLASPGFLVSNNPVSPADHESAPRQPQVGTAVLRRLK